VQKGETSVDKPSDSGADAQQRRSIWMQVELPDDEPTFSEYELLVIRELVVERLADMLMHAPIDVDAERPADAERTVVFEALVLIGTKLGLSL
jgi:hypothetical protein